jgi:dethiobiotin synthetase
MTQAFHGLFVTGTDTGVGKTRVACALLRALARRGLRPGAMKPVETGVGDAGPLDALALRAAAGSDAPLALVCPQRFALPAAPAVAAAAEGRAVDLDAIEASFAFIDSRHECVIAEGAGGLLVPVAPGLSMAGLAARLGLPLLVVARPRLGTLNHTLLTLEAARARGLAVAGVVVSWSEPAFPASERRNLAWLRESLGAVVVGELPWLPEGTDAPEGWIDLDALLAAASRAQPAADASCTRRPPSQL